MTTFVDEERAIDIIYFDKAFNTISHIILVKSLQSGRMAWKKCLDDQAQRVMVNRLYSIWVPATNEALQGSILTPLLFNNFINAIEEVAVCTLFNFADNTKMRATVNTLEDKAAIKKNLHRMEKWAFFSTMRKAQQRTRLPTEVVPSASLEVSKMQPNKALSILV